MAPLTERESEALTGLGQSLTNGQIAGHLFPTRATLKAHVLRLLEKPGCDNRTRTGRPAHEAGLR